MAAFLYLRLTAILVPSPLQSIAMRERFKVSPQKRAEMLSSTPSSVHTLTYYTSTAQLAKLFGLKGDVAGAYLG